MSSPYAQPDESVFVTHAFPERQVDLGEIVMNYAEAGSPDAPALVLIPEQTGSWWSYEQAMAGLAEQFHVFAVDLRGQGRSTRTPQRYSLDNIGNDLVRFLATVVREPAIVSGCSSGGVLAAWLAAYALPGQVRAAICEDAPLFASEPTPIVGPPIGRAAAPLFRLFVDHLGDQWSVGDWAGLVAAAKASPHPIAGFVEDSAEPPQNLREYDPEWARVFVEGTVGTHCPHDRMLAQAKVPMLLTHHAHGVDPATQDFLGAISDEQIEHARKLISSAGVPVEVAPHPDAVHVMHAADPARFVDAVTRWAAALPSSA